MKKSKPIDPTMFGKNFVREVAPKLRGIRKDRQVELSCVICETLFIVTVANAVRIKQQTCSNQCAGILRRKSENGNLNHPLYPRWLSMRDRCNNPKNDRYTRYGARGITYDSVFDDFTQYVNYCVSLANAPTDLRSTSLEIDRIDNDVGYCKGNLRWADVCLQAANKSLLKTPEHTSSTVGVCWCKTNKRWIARVQYKNQTLHQSSHLTEEAAVLARQQYVIVNDLPHQLK